MVNDSDKNNNTDIDIAIDSKNPDKNQEEISGQYEEMYRRGVHFGYSRSSRHPKMKQYLFGIRNNIEIFNLEKVYACLETARDFLQRLALNKHASFLLVATKPEAKDLIEKAGRELSMPYVTERWLGGTLTNLDVVKKQIEHFEDLRKQKEAGEFSDKYSKKEIVKLDKEMNRLEKKFGGIRFLKNIPEAIIIIDSKEERLALREAKKLNIPVVAILNSDCNPDNIDYPIPGNDTAQSSIQYLLDRLLEAYKDGLKQVKNDEEQK